MKIEIEKLAIKYNGRYILKDFDLSVEKGEFVAVVGPSGCGKTTLLNIIAGTVIPDSGTVKIDGRAVTGISDHVAYMPQDDLLLPWKNILENVTLYGRVSGGLDDARKRALGLIPAFGLSGYEKRYPAELSGGMRQRAAFLRTALCRADTLLLDEPFGALDMITRGEMQKWLKDMRRSLDRTVVMVTHDMQEADLLSDRIIVIGGTSKQRRMTDGKQDNSQKR